MLTKYYDKERKTLKIPFYFNEELKNLPSNVKIIIFEEDYDKFEFSKFNQTIGNLPLSIMRITFGSIFNQPINDLPHSLTRLTLGHHFNQPMNNLPHSLTHLTFGMSFNQPLNNLPNYLTHLTFGMSFNQPLNNLPNYLTYLTFGISFNQEVNNLPPSLKEIKIFNKSVHLLKKIPFGCKIIDEHDNEIFFGGSI